MAKLKVDQFVDLVKRSGLVDNERLNQSLSGIDQSVKDSGIIAAKLVKDGLLTEWHSEKLLQGRHKGFYLGKYKLLNHIGAGGMGAVYLAEHRVMRSRVAIKLLPQHLATQTSYLERFHQEARASASLNHPNMVGAFDVDQDGTNHYLVMEYVEGADLQAIVSRSGPLPFRMAAEYTRQAAEGLAYAHRSGLIHRDIKPANMLVDKTGTLKILDMGLARFSDETQCSLTMAYDQKMIGTIDYLSPEQALDSHKVDARVDIYSLGCTLYFMLTGDAPFPQGTVPQRLMQHQSAEPTDIRATRPDAPEELIAICRKMMAKAAADRYQSADEVSRALCEWLGEGEPKSGGSGAHPKMPPPSGPSLNEDLTLAPLDDEPAARGGSKQPAKPGDSKASGSGAGSTANKPDPSGAKKGPTSSIKNGEQVPTKPTSAIKSPAHQAPNLTKAGDPMDELLSGPALPSSEPPLQSTSLHMHTHPENPMVRSLLLVVGLGLGGAALVVGAILLIIWWSAGLF